MCYKKKINVEIKDTISYNLNVLSENTKINWVQGIYFPCYNTK